MQLLAVPRTWRDRVLRALCSYAVPAAHPLHHHCVCGCVGDGMDLAPVHRKTLAAVGAPLAACAMEGKNQEAHLRSHLPTRLYRTRRAGTAIGSRADSTP